MPRLLLLDGNTVERQRAAVHKKSRSPGMVFADTLAVHFPDVDVDRVNAAEPGDVLPPGMALADYDGLAIGGSGLHAYDDAPEVTRQIELVRAFADTGGPILGCCWGLQIAVIAAGGTVRRSPKGREIVFARKITLTDTGRAHPMYAGKPSVFDAPCIHFDEIDSLPPDASLLCSNHHSEVQGATFALGRSEVWGVQYHPEFDLRHLADILRVFGEAMIDEGFFASDAERWEYGRALIRLAADPDQWSIAWRLGINEEIVSDELRNAEVINWVRHAVLLRS
jgi:GMP synthase (glutamine-hydrolysing)